MSTNTKARQRLESLLDDNSFVEIGAKVTARATDFNLQASVAPNDGVVTGYGVIDGNLVYVYAQDASVLGGSMGEMHAKKIVNLYDMALKMGAPVIGLIDSTGLRLQESTDALEGFGEILTASALASGVVPQISAVFGSCGGGLSLVPAMSDFVLMEKDAKMYVNSPDAIEGNTSAKCDSAACSFQSADAGNVDVVADEATIYGTIRQLVAMLPANCESDSFDDCEDDLNRSSAEMANFVGGDILGAIQSMADDGYGFEVRPDYAKDVVTALIRMGGGTVGVIANREEAMGAKGCEKAATFVNFCDAFEIPLVTLTNTTGFKSCMCCEKRIAREAANLASAFANATVAKVNVIVGKSYGTAGVIMNSKSTGADMVFAWDNASVGTMDAKLAAQIICDNREEIADTAKKYEALQNNVESAAARGYVDTIITAADTRKYVIGALDMLYTKAVEIPAKKHVAK